MQITVRLYAALGRYRPPDAPPTGAFSWDIADGATARTINSDCADATLTLSSGALLVSGAQTHNLSVTRIIEGQERKIRVPVEDIGVGKEKNFQLQPGDIVFVPESFF